MEVPRARSSCGAPDLLQNALPAQDALRVAAHDDESTLHALLTRIASKQTLGVSKDNREFDML